MSRFYCGRPECREYLGSLGNDHCSLCGWSEPDNWQDDSDDDEQPTSHGAGVSVGCNVEGVTLRNDGSTVVTDQMIHAALRVQYARAGSVWTGSKANPDFTDMRHILSAAMQATSAKVEN